MVIGNEFILAVTRRFKYYKVLAEKTFEQLVDNDFYFQTNDNTNSIAIIIQHLSGNMLSRATNFLTENGEKEWRERDKEFEVHSNNRRQLLDLWEKGWDCLLSAIESCEEEDLLKTIYIKEEALSVVDAIIRQLVHYSYHVGQIVHIGKMIKGESWRNLSMAKTGK